MIKSRIILGGDFFHSALDDEGVLGWMQETFGQRNLILNFEGAIELPNSTRLPKSASLSSSRQTITSLSASSIYMSFVNNHATDMGVDTFREMLAIAGEHSVVSFASSADPRVNVPGQKLLIFADEREECVCSAADFLRFDRSVIESISDYVNGSVVIVHGGLEYREFPTPYQRELSHLLVDFGARALVFHHSHTVGVHEWVKGVLVHYGIGDFYFSDVPGLKSHEDRCGVVLELDFENDSFRYCESPVSLGGSSLERYRTDMIPIGSSTLLIDGQPNPDFDTYRSWYKKRYPVDASFRPRQLSYYEAIVRFQWHLWYAVARRLSKLGLSRHVKKCVSIMASMPRRARNIVFGR